MRSTLVQAPHTASAEGSLSSPSTTCADSVSVGMAIHPDAAALSEQLSGHISQKITADGGWWPFDRFMAAALYTPGLGYYTQGRTKLGLMPEDGSDFATAPEMTPLFGQTLAASVAQALSATQTDEVWEFGAGSGALAEQMLQALGAQVRCYTIVDISDDLRERQRARLARFGTQVRWVSRLPETFQGVVLGNEVLDAMPVQLLHWTGTEWLERGVALAPEQAAGAVGSATFVWSDRPTPLRPPVDGINRSADDDALIDWNGRFAAGTVVEIHAQAEGFIRTLGQQWVRGVAFFMDYGFPEHEYYHRQRISPSGGTLMCHQGHRSDTDPLSQVGLKDITAHINFTGIAMTAQDAGLAVLGYTSQARFLINNGLTDLMAQLQGPHAPLQRAQAARLIHEHEMGELFKVIALQAGEPDWGSFGEPLGFVQGDRSHGL
jgi:SAM-dependent MidA family methyltransferase